MQQFSPARHVQQLPFGAEAQRLLVGADAQEGDGSHCVHGSFDLAGKRTNSNELVQGLLISSFTSGSGRPIGGGDGGVALLGVLVSLEHPLLLNTLQPQCLGDSTDIRHGVLRNIGVVRPVVGDEPLFIQPLGDLHRLVG